MFCFFMAVCSFLLGPASPVFLVTIERGTSPSPFYTPVDGTSKGGIVRLLLVLRDLPRSASREPDDTPQWLAQLEQDGAVTDMVTDLKRTRAVTEHLRPDLIGLSTQRLERLHHLSGAGDLMLLDELLSGVTSRLDLDALRPDKLYQSIRDNYFKGNRHLPTICRLACLAQFELTPLASFLDGGWGAGEKDLAAPLMTELFAPRRYLLLHSSLAELVLRALLTLAVGVERLEEKVAEATGSELVAYFQYLLALQAKGDATGADATASLEILFWCGIIARGLFLNACTFVTEDLAAYPAPSQTAFRGALAQTAAPLAAKASWFDINPSRPPTDLASAEGGILRDALQARIEAFKVEELTGLDFREAVNAFAFGWREREDLRPALAAQLWDSLTDPACWPREDGEFAAFRLVLVIARSEAISQQDALRLLSATSSFLDREVCKDIDTLPLFLLLWNMAALRYERAADRSFHSTLPANLIEILLTVLRERVRPKGPNNEKLAQLALAGLLRFLLPRFGNELRGILAPLATSTRWLYNEALEQTFLPALFALEGIALFRPNEPVLTPLVSVGLLAKSKQYEEAGPAIEDLRERVKRHGNLR